MIKVLAQRNITRPEYFRNGSIERYNGRVSVPLGKIDLSRKPLLEINIPDQSSTGTRIGIAVNDKWFKLDGSTGIETFVLSLEKVGNERTVGDKAVRDLTLTMDPALLYGHYVAVRAVKVHYQIPASAPLVIDSGTVNLGANKYAVINGGTLFASAPTGSTILNTLSMVGSGTINLADRFALPVYDLSGSGNLTITGPKVWDTGVNLVNTNPYFTGKIIVNGVSLWATDASLGAVPAVTVADAISLNGNLEVSGMISATRGITLTGGGAMIFESNATFNNKITGPFALNVRGGNIVLANNANDFTGDYITDGNTTVIGVDNALPHGNGKGNLKFKESNGTSTVDLNGHTLTLNAITQSDIRIGSNIDNKAYGAAMLIVGNNTTDGSFGGVIKNTGGPLSLTKIGTKTQTLTNINTYTGATLVEGGTLALTGAGSIANSAIVTVAAGATLDATGRSDGKFTLGLGQKLVVEGTVKGLFQNGGVSPGAGTIVLSSSEYATSGTAALNLRAAVTHRRNHPERNPRGFYCRWFHPAGGR
jgi:autotransporter-associated beta strand protein